MDRRWQLVLGCLDVAAPPFSKPTLIAFRERLIATQLDRRLLERTVEVAAAPMPAQIGHNHTAVRCQGGHHAVIHRAADHQAVDKQEW